MRAARIHAASAAPGIELHDPTAPLPVGVDDFRELRRRHLKPWHPIEGVRGLLSIAS